MIRLLADSFELIRADDYGNLQIYKIKKQSSTQRIVVHNFKLIILSNFTMFDMLFRTNLQLIICSVSVLCAFFFHPIFISLKE